MSSELITISGVRGRLDASGNPELNLEDVARGLGIVKRDVKGCNTYERVHKPNLQRWLFAFGLLKSEKDNLPEYVPENIFYKLCFKAENATAIAFQDTVTDEVLPSIRKHGAYITAPKIEEILKNPDIIINLAMALKEERTKANALESELDRSKEWYSIKRVAKINDVDWQTFNWRKLKVASEKSGLGVKKIFDANYGEVNTYHCSVWEQVYPEYET